MKKILVKLPLAVAALFVAALFSCTRVILRPAPPLSLVLNAQFPMMGDIDSIEALTQAKDSELVYVAGAQLYDPGDRKDTFSNGQAEFAYPFRTSSPGAVFALGIYSPVAGYQHTVTLWDSASGEVLAQSNVYNSTNNWAYSEIPPVSLEADHGYIMGYNSDAVGVPVGSLDPGNEVYTIQGIIDFKSNSTGPLPMIPFTWKSITVEGWYYISYDTPITNPIFPTGNPMSYDVNGFFGACDIGFLPGDYLTLRP